ncbi:MAG TPA: TonB-dependent receptor [Bacteroidia bacterium]|nr:TonB-dependent receptor [Bacteroidia bacterium]
MKKIFFYLLLILISSKGLAQHELTGKITDKNTNSPIVGATVYIPDLKLGATTDTAGKYLIKNIPKGTFLALISFLGYASQTKEVEIKETAFLDFTLEDSGTSLTEVIVTGVSSATEQRNNPIPINIVNQKDLLQNSATNIIDAIAMTPGVSQITLGPNISKPIIRGLGYNRVVTVNDGVRQEGQQWFDEFGIEIDEFSVNKVEILKGPASLAYGSDAMAGVINMLSAPPLPEGQIKGKILANYQSNNGLLASSINLAGNHKGFIWDVRYTNKMAHDYQNKYDGYVSNSAYSESNAKALIGINRKWGYSHLTLSSFDLKMGIIEGARDSASGKFTRHYQGSGRTDSTAITPTSDFTKYNNFPVIHQHVRHYKAVLDNSFALGTGRLNFRLGFQQNMRQEANDLKQGDTYNNYFFLRTLNYDLRYVLAEKNHFEMSFGVNGMQQNSQNLGTAFVIPEYSIFDIGGFVIAKKSFKKLSLSGGLRYETRMLQGKNLWVDSTGKRLSGPVTGSIADFKAYTSNFSGLSGSFGSTYDITSIFYAKLNISRGYRAPTAAESGANGIHDGTPFYEIGDHRLKAESSMQYDLSLGINSKDVWIELTGFVNNINNYIFAEKLHSQHGGDSIRLDPALALAAGPAFKYVQGDATLSGGEAILNIRPAKFKWINFDNSFSFVSAIQKNQPDSTKYLPYTPPPKYRTELKFIYTKGKIIKNAYIKVGLDYYFVQNKIYYKYGNETVTPDYGLLNAGIGGDICSKKQTLFSLYIYANNITDVAYQSNMSRLKYTALNNATGRIGVYNMGRNISFKLVVPLNFKN